MITNTINPIPKPALNRVFFPGPTSRKPNPPLNPKSSSLHFSPNPSSCNSQISAMALHLCRPKHRLPNNPSLIHLFSTSPDDNDDKDATQTTPTTTTNKTSLNSYFSDVKASLKKQTTTYPSSSSLEEIRKNLAEYRQRSAPPPPSPPPTGESISAASQSQPVSFQELYRRNQNLNQNSEVKPGSGKLSFEAIKESLRRMKANSNSNMNMNDNRSNMNAGSNTDSLSMFAFRNSLKSKGQDGVGGSGSRVIGGTQELPVSVFGREMKEGKKGGEKERERMKTEFVKMYSYVELGEKLRQLRPVGGKSGEGFSLQELNERLVRLRELEEKESESRIGGVTYRDLRESLQRLKLSGEEKQKKSSGLYAILRRLLSLSLLLVNLGN